jgi:predicted ATPase/DNA-binding SARP family transcriptional activator
MYHEVNNQRGSFMENRPKLPRLEAPALRDFDSEQKDTSKLYIRLLGGFGVWLDGTEIPDTAFVRRKPKSLLKLLALHGANRLHRDQVIEALWPGLQPLSGAAQLYKAVHQARKALLAAGSGIPPETILVLQDEALHLVAPGGVGTDAEGFEALARLSLLSRNRADLERALTAYGGDLLPTDLYEDWTLEAREALREQATALELALGEVRLEAGELSGAQESFYRTLRLDPLREAAHRGLMRVHAHLGDRVGLERQYRRYAEALSQSLDASPSPETARFYRALLEDPRPAPTQGASKSPPLEPTDPVRHNLPSPPSPFVGRTPELTEIAERLGDPECRLLTLVGPGGVGKTRLGLQAVASQLEDFAGAVYFVPLAQIAGPEFLLGAVAEALQVALYPNSDPKAQLLERLKGESALVMLDNFEHLLGGAELIAELLEVCPRLKLLITSRERLGLQSEWLFEVSGLDYPTTQDEGLETYSAVRLFLQHLRRVRPGSTPDRADLRAVARICRLVDGFPLSLELAAAQGRALSCFEIADEIERGLGVLEASLRDLPARHRTQRAAFEPSWQSLSVQERQVFARLSVFRGGFRREAAEAVAGATLQILSSLVDKSLLRRAPFGRYNLHELLRQFGEEKLGAQSKELKITRDRHAHFYCQFLAQQETRLKGSDHQAALTEIVEELDNIRTAWRWAASRGNVSALGVSLGALWVFVASRGSSLWAEQEEALCHEVIRALEERGVPQHDPMLGRLKTGWAAMNYRLGLYEQPEATLREAIVHFRHAGANGELAFALHHLAGVTQLLGDYTQTQTLLRESISLSQTVGDAWLTAYSQNDLGLATHLSGDDLEAEQCCTQSLGLFERIGDPRGKAYALANLGVITLALERPDEARRFHLAALAQSRENADRWVVAVSLLHLGDVAVAVDKPDEARRLIHEALSLAANERIQPVALSALTHLAALASVDEKERALDWLSLVLAHPSTARKDWGEAQKLRTTLENLQSAPSANGLEPEPAGVSGDRLTAQEAAVRLETIAAEILREDG